MNRSRAFTLVEMLVVTSIFAIMSLAAGQFLGQGVQAEGEIRGRSERFNDLLRAMQRIDLDVQGIRLRKVRGADGEPLAAWIAESGEGYVMEFTRDGWRNPMQHRRSELQRVAYLLADGSLVRLFWNVLDRAESTQPQRQILLDDVSSFSVEVTATRSDNPDNSNNAEDGVAAVQLIGVRLRLEVPPFGGIERLYHVPNTGQPEAPGGAGG